MASVASQLIEEVTAHRRMRERYAQTVLTVRIAYVPLSGTPCCEEYTQTWEKRHKSTRIMLKSEVQFITAYVSRTVIRLTRC